MVLSNQDLISNLVQQFLAYNFLKTFKREGLQLPHSSRREGSPFCGFKHDQDFMSNSNKC
jgi:hypothetical protein